MNNIDKFVYINLDKRKDRNEHILKELQRFNIPESKIIRVSAIESTKGAYGCSLSHLKVMQLFKESGDKVWCILEDDHYFTHTLEETDKIVSNFLKKEEYDVLLGCYCNVKGRDLPDGVFRRTSQSSMTSFFIVKSNVCDGLIASHKQSSRSLNPKFGKKTGIPCDFMWSHLMKVFFFVAPYKPYGSQILDYSDIRHKRMNYSTYVGLKVDRDIDGKI
jgi:glycosyl transferase family 25